MPTISTNKQDDLRRHHFRSAASATSIRAFVNDPRRWSFAVACFVGSTSRLGFKVCCFMHGVVRESRCVLREARKESSQEVESFLVAIALSARPLIYQENVAVHPSSTEVPDERNTSIFPLLGSLPVCCLPRLSWAQACERRWAGFCTGLRASGGEQEPPDSDHLATDGAAASARRT